MSYFRYLQRKEIDEFKWNELITKSEHTFPYAYSWYLDVVAENWNAIVFGEYQAAMPVVWLRKLGVKCIYQPYFCQQLGLFYIGKISISHFSECLDHLKKNFFYADMNLNASARLIQKEQILKGKKNLVLNLLPVYSELAKKYSPNHKRNIAKAKKSSLQLVELSEDQFLAFFIKHIQQRQDSFKKKHASILRSLTSELKIRNAARLVGVTDKDGDITSVSMLLLHHKRIINIAQASSDAGRSSGSAHFLFDQIIEQYTGSDKILDFEGSSVPSIARFYKGFGAEEEEFYNFRFNRLKKSPFELLKK